MQQLLSASKKFTLLATTKFQNAKVCNFEHISFYRVKVHRSVENYTIYINELQKHIFFYTMPNFFQGKYNILHILVLLHYIKGHVFKITHLCIQGLRHK